MSTYLTRFLEIKNKKTGKWELVKCYKKFYKTQIYVDGKLVDNKPDFTVDGKDMKCGQYGFIHEYIPVGEGASNLTINIPSDNIAISDIRIFSEGQLPSDVQVWNPPCEKLFPPVLPDSAFEPVK